LDRPSTDEERDAALSAPPGSPKRIIDRTAEKESFDRAIAKFEVWLERKVKGGPAALRP
jgi:hypothetical protein